MPILAQFQAPEVQKEDKVTLADVEPESSSEEEASGEDVEKAVLSKQDAYQKKLIKLELERMVGDHRIVVPSTPAPPQSPGRSKKSVPSNLIAAKPPTALERTMNSTLGRSFTILFTMINFAVLIQLIIVWNSPAAWLSGEAVFMGSGVLLFSTNLYGFMPAMARTAGLMPINTGVDWKPYFIFYRMSFFTSVPAAVMMWMGPGARNSFGEFEGGIEDISTRDLTQGSYKYFRAYDGFVALNLTKGITETLLRTDHSENVPRKSRYRDAEVVNNYEPYSDEVQPTVPPGFQETYRIAPVFPEWAPCTTRYRISGSCLKENQVVGWALATARSACTNFRAVSCRKQQPLLDPYYHCATDSVRGAQDTGVITGLCGRSVPPPSAEVIDELNALLLLDGWPLASLANSSHGWYDVWMNDCIGGYDECEKQWSLYELLGMILIGLTAVLAVLPIFVDCYFDKQIRRAQDFVESCKKSTTKSTAVF
mmetsp:Transcript_98901/g.176207  ORF Transcript_98901/g.176207 Transcript_98901/m.176207 type:complete len:481 (-) Transcript_98901:34-1476(-)|eukprot:CAMPEP_0197655932 /NCGR_PEP_ID=MMETSP1338-20131121/39758_1 /TAXON_ID=43686 ORGANISM="Pelagodinium beii, Strain RCC1491" /NCGR_SAMPLE_ID=MMETSP1338 /ASSEMBLY_ACC=CAM_ASM_000754 /LENGTH=480 /DNA_ID=CAMNT_0043231681 /DNA_START=33 /DNA_END=1475 /DNA_ORIENTATION=-